MDPLGPDPLIRSFERRLYAENRSSRTVTTTYLIAVRQAYSFLRERGSRLEAATRGDLEAFLDDLLSSSQGQHRRDLPQCSQDPLRLACRGSGMGKQHWLLRCVPGRLVWQSKDDPDQPAAGGTARGAS